MPYIDSQRVLCSSETNPRWYIKQECQITKREGFERVYDYELKQFRYQASDKKSWCEYLISIGKLTLLPSQKIDGQGNIVNKTIDEMYATHTIGHTEYKSVKVSEIKRSFEYGCLAGAILSGTFQKLSSGSVLNPKFSYDKDSWQLLESVLTDSRVGYWRSVDNDNVILTNQDKADLLEVLKVTYFTKFAESRQQIDSL